MPSPEGWSAEANTLSKLFGFDTYMDGVKFATRVAELAEKHNHHPEITIGYQEVKITTTTHDAGNVVTERDIKLATEINKIYEL